MTDAVSPEIEAEAMRRALALIQEVGSPPPVPDHTAARWAKLPEDHVIAISKGAFRDLMETLGAIPKLALDACNVAADLTSNNREDAYKTFESIARSAVRATSRLEGTLNRVMVENAGAGDEE